MARTTSTGWAVLVVVALVCTGSHSVLLALAKDASGHVPFAAAVVVLVQESGKLLVASLLELRAQRWAWRRTARQFGGALQEPRHWLFAVPALCYALNNNLAVHMQTQMDPATFQVLCNLKIGTTAALFHLFLSRRLRPHQWAAIALLGAAAVANTCGTYRPAAAAGGTGGAAVFVTPLGLVEMALYCLVSGFAGVFTERLLKARDAGLSFFQQNMLLYIFGCALNGAAVVLAPPPGPWFAGLGRLAAVIILSQVTNGLLYGVIMRYADNMLRLFIIGGAMLLSTLLSAGLLGLHMTPLFVAAVGLAGGALVLYYPPAAFAAAVGAAGPTVPPPPPLKHDVL